MDYKILKVKIEEFVSNYGRIISADYLDNIVKSIEGGDTKEIINEIRIYLDKYGELCLKSDAGEILYELVRVFREIDETYEDEAE